MAEGKSKVAIWVLVIVALVAYLVWAYNSNCCGEAKTTNCGCDPITDWLHNFLHNLLIGQKKSNAYQDCVSKNKKLPDGSDCENCIAEGSNVASFKGKIKDGECVAVTNNPTGGGTGEVIKGQVQISNQNGTFIFTKDDTLNEMKITNQVIPFGSKINYVDIVNLGYCSSAVTGQCYAPTDFYKMVNNQGFVINKDVTILNSPQ